MDVNEIEDYYSELVKAVDGCEEKSIFNNDRIHNATILRLMFDKSDDVRMYCGEMSVFRKGFFDNIEKSYSKKIADYVKDELIKSFEKFLNKKRSSLFIILEKSINKCWNDLICEAQFLKYMNEGKIKVSYLPDYFTYKEGFDHYSFTNTNILRLEEDKIQHNAVCICNGESYIDTLNSNFDLLKKIAEPAKI